MKAFRWFQWFALAVNTVFGAGFVGKLLGKPGKWGGTGGSLVAFGVQLWLFEASIRPLLALTVVSFFLGWIACRPGEALLLELGGVRKRHTGESAEADFNETCSDEFHGQLLAGLPLWYWHEGWPGHRLLWLVIALVLFRIFDAKKPGPIGAIEQHFKHSGGFGVMIDDTAAATIVAITLILGRFATHYTLSCLR